MWPEARRIDTEYVDGPFKHMISNWEFEDTGDGGCAVRFKVDFEFRNRLLQGRGGHVLSRGDDADCAGLRDPGGGPIRRLNPGGK